MHISSISRALCGVAFLVASLPFTLGTAEASIVTNGTTTIFNVGTGQIDFDWDQGSQYDIIGTNVILESDDTGSGIVYEFVIPNFYDPLPKKTIWVTMEGLNSGATLAEQQARVLDIIGADSDFISGGPSLPVVASLVTKTSSSTSVVEHWEMFPNPDFEIVKIYAPHEFELESIRIETQSLVPVPAAVWLFGSGLLGLIGIARRKKT